MLYGPNGLVLWAAASNSGGSSVVTMDDWGALAVCNGTAASNVTSMRWSSGGRYVGSWIPTSSYFHSGDYLVSPSKNFTAVLKTDGNLVITDGYGPYSGTGAVRWQSNSGGHTGPDYASLQPDGNFVIYAGTGPNDFRGTVWAASSTAGTGQYVLLLDDYGALRVYSGSDPAHLSTLRWSGPADMPVAPANTLNGLSYVALRAPSGHWLSSQPNGTLYFSPNSSPSTWEQWLIVKDPNSNTYYLQSYFGKTLTIPPGGSSTTLMSDAFSGYDTNYLLIQRAYDSSGNAIFGPINSGKILFGIGSGYVMSEGATAPIQQQYTMVSPADDAARYHPWTIVSVTPATGTAARQMALLVYGPLYLKTPAGKIFSWGRTTDPEVASVSSTGSSITASVAGLTARTLLQWGSALELSQVAGGQRVVVQPGGSPVNGQPGVIWHYTSGTRWTVIDPSGQGVPGGRVPGARVCLRPSGTQSLLSANPSIPQTMLSPNGCAATGTWEQWVFTEAPANG